MPRRYAVRSVETGLLRIAIWCIIFQYRSQKLKTGGKDVLEVTHFTEADFFGSQVFRRIPASQQAFVASKSVPHFI